MCRAVRSTGSRFGDDGAHRLIIGFGTDEAALMCLRELQRQDRARGCCLMAGGRPRAEIDLGLVERSAHIGCTNDEIVALLGIGRSTFYDRLKDDPELQAVIDRGRAVGRATLRRLQWQGAENGNATMLVWLGKNMLSQTDKIENSGTTDVNTRLIVELVGDAAPAIEHEKQQQRFTPRLVTGDVVWKGVTPMARALINR